MVCIEQETLLAEGLELFFKHPASCECLSSNSPSVIAILEKPCGYVEGIDTPKNLGPLLSDKSGVCPY